MDLMAAVLLFVFAILFSIVFNWGAPRVMAYPRFQKLQGSYAGKTFVTALAVFAFLIAVSYAMAAAGRKPQLPG